MAGVWRCVAAAVLMCVCLWDSTEAVGGAVSRPRLQRTRHKKPKVELIDLAPVAQSVDIQQVNHWTRTFTFDTSGTFSYDTVHLIEGLYNKYVYIVLVFYLSFQAELWRLEQTYSDSGPHFLPVRII